MPEPPPDDLDFRYPEPDPDLYSVFNDEDLLVRELTPIRDRNRAIKARLRAERAAALARGERIEPLFPEPEPPDDLDFRYPEPDPDLIYVLQDEGELVRALTVIRDRNRAIKDRIRAERAAAAAARAEQVSS